MNTKICTQCSKELSLDSFTKHSTTKSGLNTQCKFCRAGNKRKYDHSHRGKMKRMYGDMVTRSKKRGHPLPSFTFNSFINWLSRNAYDSLYFNWRDSNYLADLAPSIDRLNSSLPYTMSNIRLVTWVSNKYKTDYNEKIALGQQDVPDIICIKCGVSNTRDNIVIGSTHVNGKFGTCKLCRNRRVCNNRNSYIGKSIRLYESISRQSQDKGFGTLEYNHYFFYRWLKKGQYGHIYAMWLEHSFATALAPTIIRKSKSIGYTLDNLQVVTVSTYRSGGVSKHGLEGGYVKPIVAYTYKTDPELYQVHAQYDSPADAAKDLGVTTSNITRAARGKGRAAEGYVWFFAGDDTPEAVRVRCDRTRAEYDKQNKAFLTIISTEKDKIVYDNATTTAKIIGITPDSIHNRCKSHTQPNWQYGQVKYPSK